jgi:hypothetical protein
MNITKQPAGRRTRPARSSAPVRTAEVMMSLLIGMLAGWLVALALPREPIAAVVGIPVAIAVALIADFVISRVRRSYLAND